eukprot:587396-Prymnesium_polylepis.1
MRIVVYVFMPAFVFTDALNDQPLLFWPLLAVVARLLRALLDAGMPKDPLVSPAEARSLVLEWAKSITARSRALDTGNVVTVGAPAVGSSGDWLAALLPPMLRGADVDNSIVADFIVSIP